MKAFIIEADGLYLTDADFAIDEAKWTEEIDLATPFKDGRAAWRAVEKWNELYRVELICRVMRHDF